MGSGPINEGSSPSGIAMKNNAGPQVISVLPPGREIDNIYHLKSRETPRRKLLPDRVGPITFYMRVVSKFHFNKF